MAFQNTLRWVQVTRASAIISTCISVIMFSFILDMRFQNRQQVVSNIMAAAPGVFDDKFKKRSGFGSMALFGLALSLVWNGLCLFDLCVKKHYRFERRVCIFLDMVVAMVLLVTGFLNFAYDSLLYFDLDIAPRSQVILEIAAVAFLGLSCLCHLGFFCHGCKDSSSSSLRSDEFDHELLQSASPVFAPEAFLNPRPLQSRSGLENQDDLVEIDLGQKVRFVKVQHHQFSDGTTSSPVIHFEQVTDPRRGGFVAPKSGEASPFLNRSQSRDWV